MENEERYERYIPVEMSILGSLLEIREMQAGRLPKRTWKDFLAELRENDEQEKQDANLIDAKL